MSWFSEEHEAFRESVARFVDREVRPRAAEIDERATFPWEVIRKEAELGYFGIRYPEEVGGAGGDMRMFCILCEELARGSMSVAMATAMQCLMSTDFIYRYGKPHHIEEFLKPAIRGEKIGAFALTEPDAGSDLASIKTRAIRDGDEYVLNGTKMWITNASVADMFTVLASTDPEKKLKGVDFFLVPKGTSGLRIGERIEKLGVKGSEICELVFEDCRIPAENLLGEAEGTGFKNLLKILNQIRVMTGALSIGLCRAALDDSLRYAQERVQFGRPIFKFQAIQHKLAEMATLLEASRLLVYNAAYLIDQGKDCPKESATAKLFASEAACKLADEATRIFASYGFAMEYPAQRYFRDARFLLYGGGTSEILKNIVAAQLAKG